jgi:hypothetical protein
MRVQRASETHTEAIMAIWRQMMEDHLLYDSDFAMSDRADEHFLDFLKKIYYDDKSSAFVGRKA